MMTFMRRLLVALAAGLGVSKVCAAGAMSASTGALLALIGVLTAAAVLAIDSLPARPCRDNSKEKKG